MQLKNNDEAQSESNLMSPQLAQKNLLNWFGASKAVDAAGQPKVFFHSTFENFTVFKEATDYHLGFHVGTLDSAQERIALKRAEMERDGRDLNTEPVILELYIKAEKPLRLNECRTGHWGASTVLQAVMEQVERDGIEGFSMEDVDAFYDDMITVDGQAWGDPSRELSDNDFVRKWLISKNIDSIIYNNEFEGGGDSYLLLDPCQIKSANLNAGLYDGNNPNIYDKAELAPKMKRRAL